MGLFSKLKRDFNNAGAKVSISVNFADDLEHRERLGSPWLFRQYTGLELHNCATSAKKEFLRVLNAEPKYKVIIKLPDDYWRLGTRALQPLYQSSQGAVPDQAYEFACNTASLIVESAFTAFEIGDSLALYFLRSGEVWVECLSSPSYELKRKLLGNASDWPENA